MVFGFNAYNTTDPEQLLELKRQEAEAMLQIVRSDVVNLSPRAWIDIVVSTIRRQLGVRRLQLITNIGGRFIKWSNFGFPEYDDDFYRILVSCRGITEPSFDRFQDLMYIGVEYIIPLGRRDYPDAWFLIADFAESEAEVSNDLIFIETAGNIMIISLKNKYLYEERLDRQRLERDLEVASEIQRQSMPKPLEGHPLLDVVARSQPHQQIGGDFYEWVPTNQDELYICIGDAAGKGIPAALVISNIHASLRVLIETSDNMRDLVLMMNNVISRITNKQHFATLFIGKINLVERTITYINAGHIPPVLLSGGELVELNTGTIPLGILELPYVHSGVAAFNPGDTLLMITDGVTEQEDQAGNFFGADRVKIAMQSGGRKGSQHLLDHLLTEVYRFANGTPISDDMTMMAVHFVGKS
jgi:phosphoserine phosphatase RsbU/P